VESITGRIENEKESEKARQHYLAQRDWEAETTNRHGKEGLFRRAAHIPWGVSLTTPTKNRKKKETAAKNPAT